MASLEDIANKGSAFETLWANRLKEPMVSMDTGFGALHGIHERLAREGKALMDDNFRRPQDEGYDRVTGSVRMVPKEYMHRLYGPTQVPIGR